MPSRASSLFSRIILVLVVFVCLGAALWIGSKILEPVPVPPVPPAKKEVQFDSRVDVSKDAVFQQLLPQGPAAVDPGTLGRLNPFAPVPSATTSVTGFVPVTSTASVPFITSVSSTTSTLPL